MNTRTSTTEAAHPTRTQRRTLRAVPRQAPDDSIEVLRCRSTADLLAALPFITGFTDENSLFVVLFQGKRSGDAMRLDLPEEQTSEALSGLLDLLLQMLRETGSGAESPAIVLHTTQSFAENGEAPWSKLAGLLKQRFREQGWRLRELAVIASDGWAGMLGERQGVQRSLNEISQSPIAAAMRERPGQPRPLESLADLPTADQARSESVQHHLQQLEKRRLARLAHPSAGNHPAKSGGARHPRPQFWVHGAARVAGACFDPRGEHAEQEIDPRLLSRLIDTAQTPQGWLVLALTALTRAEFVIEVTGDWPPGRFSNMPVDTEADTGSDTGSGAETAPGGAWSIRRLLFALAHDTPEPQKLRAAVSAIADAAAHAPKAQRPALLALLAWAWWMLGLQSVAHRLIRQALSIDADHELALMVSKLCESPPASRLLDFRKRLAA